MSGNGVLTDQQRHVLNLIGAGRNTKEIASELGVSPKTVEFHRKGMFDKLGLRSQMDALAYCQEHKLVAYNLPESKMQPLANTVAKKVSDIEAILEEMMSQSAQGKANAQQVSCVVALTGAWLHVQRLKMDARFMDK